MGHTVLVVIGTRPEAIKMAPVIWALRERGEGLQTRICVTGQHREMLRQALASLDLRPDVDLDLMLPGQTLAELTARVIQGMDQALAEAGPAMVLVQGDTTTVMATALAAFYRRIPVGHVEAGLRTGDRYYPFPEEINRRLASQLATLHFAPTQRAAEALRREGIGPEGIYVTGNPVVDALRWMAQQPEPAEVQGLLQRIGWAEQGGRQLILVTAHRRESFGAPLVEICRGLKELARRNGDVAVVYPVHLNPQVRETVWRILGHEERVYLVEPMAYDAFVHLMKRAKVI